MSNSLTIWAVEFPIILLAVSLFYLHDIKNKFIKYVIPIMPFIGVYIVFDVFYYFLSRPLKYTDFENINLLYKLSPLIYTLSVLLSLSIFAIIFYNFYKVYKTYNKKKIFLSIFIRLSIILAALIVAESDLFSSYTKNLFERVVWSDTKTIAKNGRINSFALYSMAEIENQKKLRNQQNNTTNIAKVLYSGNIKNKKNIYYIVMESFVYPNYFTGIKYNKNPLHNDLKELLFNGDFSKVRSPVYGGGTAQAEFELLTGIRALSKVNSIEFNVMQGGKINAFLNALKNNGYKNIATIASDSKYFNSTLAYKSLGFEKVTFLEKSDFIKNNNDSRIFDGDAFDYNLKKIKNHLKTSDKPIFSYILGLYGHLAYKRNKIDRPDKIKSNDIKNENIFNIVNQFYYRTQALAKYIKNILAIDKNSLIVVSSDHLPPIYQNIKYKYDKYTNIALMTEDGKAININGKSQFEIPWIIWDRLTKNNQVRLYDDHTMKNMYFKALYESLNMQHNL